jgi:hypothetical protein
MIGNASFDITKPAKKHGVLESKLSSCEVKRMIW